jgi:hypothetical protein
MLPVRLLGDANSDTKSFVPIAIRAKSLYKRSCHANTERASTMKAEDGMMR